MKPRQIISRIGIAAFTAALTGQLAFASFLDTDFHCQTYGCVVVSDGTSYIVYDVYDFDADRCCIPVGSPLKSFNRGAGVFAGTNVTGTLDTAVPPSADEGNMFSVVDGGGNIVNAVIDDGDGFLDADDTLFAFGIDGATDIALTSETQTYSHSFYITSRSTRFSLQGRASLAGSTGDLSNSVTLADIGFIPSVTRRGNDDGFNFGGRANRGNININNALTTLQDLSGAPTEVIQFRRQSGIRQRSGSLEDQMLRLDFLYTLPGYDLSMGVGDLNLEVTFDFYRER